MALAWRDPAATAGRTSASPSARWPRRRSGRPPRRPSSRAPSRRPRWRTAPPRRSPASSSRSTTSARPPTTGARSPRGSCTDCSATPAAGDGGGSEGEGWLRWLAEPIVVHQSLRRSKTGHGAARPQMWDSWRPSSSDASHGRPPTSAPRRTRDRLTIVHAFPDADAMASPRQGAGERSRAAYEHFCARRLGDLRAPHEADLDDAAPRPQRPRRGARRSSPTRSADSCGTSAG